MNTKTDEGLYEKARKLFISKASIDEFAGWATPRQVDAVHRLLDTELANRERAKHDRLLRCFASMFVRQVRQCFSVVWADGFPRCRHRFPVM